MGRAKETIVDMNKTLFSTKDYKGLFIYPYNFAVLKKGEPHG